MEVVRIFSGFPADALAELVPTLGTNLELQGQKPQESGVHGSTGGRERPHSRPAHEGSRRIRLCYLGN